MILRENLPLSNVRPASALLIVGMLFLAFLTQLPFRESPGDHEALLTSTKDIERGAGVKEILEENSSLNAGAREKIFPLQRRGIRKLTVRETSISVCHSNITEHDGDLVIKGRTAVIRNCKFILRGSLLVLEKASLSVENASLLLALPSPSVLPNITISSSSLLANSSIIGTTDLLMAFPFFILNSEAEILSSSLCNTSLSCLNSIITMTNATIKKSLDVRGSSYLMMERSELEEMALRNFSSAFLRDCQLNYLALWFSDFTELSISGLRPGYMRLWDPELNCTVKTICLSIRLERCWVGAWGIGAVDSAIVDMLSSELEDLGAYDMAMVDLTACDVGYGVLIRDRASLDMISSDAPLVQILETASFIMVNGSAEMVMASGTPYVELKNSTISFFSAEFGVRARASFSSFDDVDISCLGRREAYFTNCTIGDTVRVMGFCSVAFQNSTMNKLFARGSAHIWLYDSLAMNLTVEEQARVEVLWSLAVAVLLDSSPLPGADVIAYFSNGTEAMSCKTSGTGCCKFFLLEKIVKASDVERLGPYDIRVSYALFWASMPLDPVGPSRLEVSFESLVELDITCLDLGGEPLEGALVAISSTGEFSQNATTGPGGHISLKDTPPGNYTIEVFWSGVKVAEAYIVIHGFDEALTLSCEVIDVFISVRGPTGPVEGAQISLRLKGAPDVVFTGKTNSSGWACIENVLLGEYGLTVEAQGFKTYEREVDLSSPGQVIEVFLEPLPSEGGGLLLIPLLSTAVAIVLGVCGAVLIKKHRRKAVSS